MSGASWNRLAQRLGVAHPIIQAPMGGVTTPQLVAAVSEAGGLGSVAAAYLSPEQIERDSQEIRRLTQRPFSINLFAPMPVPARGDRAQAEARLAPLHAARGLPPPQVPERPLPDFAQQVEAVLAARPALLSFCFGILDQPILERFRSAGCLLAGTATTAAEARALEAAGVDVVVAQSMEAGGQRGTFGQAEDAPLVGMFALLPQVVDAVRLPVVAAGAIMDGRGVAAARVLGASGVQVGTAFLCSRESGAPPAYKALLRRSPAEASRIVRALSGRPGRALENELTRAFDEEATLPFPLQHGLTQPLRAAARRADDTRQLALWTGQGSALARDVGAGELVRALAGESEEALREAR